MLTSKKSIGNKFMIIKKNIEHQLKTQANQLAC